MMETNHVHTHKQDFSRGKDVKGRPAGRDGCFLIRSLLQGRTSRLILSRECIKFHVSSYRFIEREKRPAPSRHV